MNLKKDYISHITKVFDEISNTIQTFIEKTKEDRSKTHDITQLHLGMCLGRLAAYQECYDLFRTRSKINYNHEDDGSDIQLKIYMEDLKYVLNKTTSDINNKENYIESIYNIISAMEKILNYDEKLSRD